ncbi:hypothetical protein J4Q44_G00168500 [Coregonus suidteri]|uniref:Uncharacterized protein n=1 Tax=Coregonus suidteri TaxID=861788 RepID=A0AAN8QWL9_9TELE
MPLLCCPLDSTLSLNSTVHTVVSAIHVLQRNRILTYLHAAQHSVVLVSILVQGGLCQYINCSLADVFHRSLTNVTIPSTTDLLYISPDF